MRYHISARANRRSGVILLVVMAMLSLFASVALAFVFYADSEAQAANTNMLALNKNQPDVDPETLASYFLAQLVYGTNNPYSSMRGHSLADTLYGYNPFNLNHTPFNGPGRGDYPFVPSAGVGPTLGSPPGPIAPMRSIDMVNFTKYDSDNWERFPGFFGDRLNPNFRYAEGTNVPWTAPDRQNMFLSVMSADGTVMLRSFDRPWTSNNATPGSSQRYATLRPHGSWHPGFAGTLPDQDAGGDVRNNDAGTGFLGGGNNDSIWMDLGFPVMTAPNGRRYKALFAPLIVDLSNRLHLLAHGNRSATNAPYRHGSNQGIGAPDVNLARGLFATGDPQYAQKMSEIDGLYTSRYGGANPTGIPFPLGPGGLWFSRYDYNAITPAAPFVSSDPFFTGFSTTTTAAIPPGAQTMPVIAVSGVTSNGFPWSLQPGMLVGVDTGNSFETVTVTSVTAAPPSFVATFGKAHPGGTTVAFSTLFPFPNFPAGWDNGNAAEMTNNPLGFNFINPQAPGYRRPMSMSHMEALLRHRGTNAPATTSELFRSMPLIFNNIRNRNMVTLWNTHLDRITSAPFLPFDRNTPNHYLFDAKKGYPVVNGKSFLPADLSNPASVSATNSEFAPDWRSSLSMALRINLNRPLRDYPAQNAAGVMDVSNLTVDAQYSAAWQDRHALAKDIYNALLSVTGAQDPNVVFPKMATTTDEYKAARWLAQFAVNIVDYIDSDDYSTPFAWNTTEPTEYVFGTELPRLVVSEVYGQLDNDGTGKGKGKAKGNPNPPSNQDLNLWVELHNPLTDTPAGNPYPRDGGNARLVINGNAVYQIVYALSNNGLSNYLRSPDNQLGDLDQPTIKSDLFSIVQDWIATPANPVTEQVLPAKGSPGDPTKTNKGYYVIGPPPNYTPATDPNLPTTHQSAWMSTSLDNNLNVSNVTVLLRRLACPHLPHNAIPGARYNPYITVDYVDNVPVGDRRLDNGKGKPSNQVSSAFGRKHPYSAYMIPPPGNVSNSQVVAQPAVGGNQPPNTFFLQNSPAETPFEWLTHLDRPLINQLELLQVSAYKQHELTQQFVVNKTRFSHRAPWGDPTAFIHRVLDLIGTPNSMAGSYRGGRWQGNVNLNTLMEEEVLQALCDSQDFQASPLFRQADVQQVFRNIMVARTPFAGGDPRQPINDPTPFKSFAAANVNDTLFRSVAGLSVFGETTKWIPTRTYQPGDRVEWKGSYYICVSSHLFQEPPNAQYWTVGRAHPYAQTALLQKIFNNVSTTSNVFAVWFTVGYFEIVDETVRPARLGQEIGRSENRHIRHRFFAIVDRSAMRLFNTQASQAIAAGANQFAAVPAFTGATGNTIDGVPIGFQPGMLLEVDSGAATEVVVVKQQPAWLNGIAYTTGQFVVFNGTIYRCVANHTAAAANAPPNPTFWSRDSFTADFTMNHAAGAVIVCRGNPGPQTVFPTPWLPNPPPVAPYNVRKDTDVVLHLSVIQ